MLTVKPQLLENLTNGQSHDRYSDDKACLPCDEWRWHLAPVSGGYMIRINGFPLYQLGLALGAVLEKINNPSTLRDELLSKLTEARPYLEFTAKQSYLPSDTKNAAQFIVTTSEAFTANTDAPQLPALTPTELGNFIGAMTHFYTILNRDLAWFDLYWIEPKLGYSTPDLLTDASVIFPPSIKAALSPRIKFEVQQATNCLLYGASTAVGFHVLRAIEIVVLDYFTIPGFVRENAATWSEYVRALKKHNVHPKIRTMIARLADLHRNELMHAEAVLSVEEAAILFAMMQETLPIMIADVAKRKGAPIAGFPILNDPRWQP